MDNVFLLWYVHKPDSADENELLIGVYSTEEAAKAAIGRLRDRPGFIDALEGFQIAPYQIDCDHWTEGFVITRD